MVPSSGVCDMLCSECPFPMCAKDILEHASETYELEWSELELKAPEIVEISLNLEGKEWWE